MTLLNDLFVVLENHDSETGFITTIELNAPHVIYTGHFPGHPVTPGVIQMQIIHELLEKHFGRRLQLITMAQCKFLKILNPLETPQIVIHIEFHQIGELLKIKARGENNADIFFKIDSSFQFK
ncbi:MAG: 3-hydroxyacyl-ACP dehydratase [Ferruginibacter sp.]